MGKNSATVVVLAALAAGCGSSGVGGVADDPGLSQPEPVVMEEDLEASETSLPSATEQPDSLPSEQPVVMSCGNDADLDAIGALLRTGLPVYDYQPAADIAQLVGWSDLSITGTINAAVREPADRDGYTALDVIDVEVLVGDGDVTRLGTMSLWASGQGPDPLGAPVAFDGLRFVAVLEGFPNAPGGYTPFIEGLSFGCGDDGPTQALIQPFPDLAGISVRELAAAVGAAGEVSPDTEPSATGAVDGPVIRHPNRSEDEEGMAAQVLGVLELEGACLYVSLEEVGERYPIVWPASTTWDAADEAVVLPSGERVRIGDSVDGSGGYLYVDNVRGFVGDDAADAAEACVDNEYGEIAVVNNFDDAIARS